MKKALVLILVFLLLGAAALMLSIDSLAKRAITNGISHATGTPTTVGNVDLGLISGRLDVRKLAVANPEGYTTPSLFRLDKLDVAVRPQSLLHDTVHLPRLVIDGALLSLERNEAQTNFGTVLKHIQRVTAVKEHGKAEESRPSAKKKRFIIDELRVNDVSLQASLAKELGKRGEVRATLPPVTLHDVGSGSGGVTISQLASMIIENLLKSVSDKGGLPADLQQELAGALKQVRELPEAVREQTQRSQEQAQQRAREELEKEKKRLLEQGKKLLGPDK